MLGCTHFPLLQPQLVTLAPVPISWVDSGDAIARRVGQVATTLVSSAHDGRCYTTAPATALTDGFARYGFQPPRLLALPDAREAVDQ